MGFDLGPTEEQNALREILHSLANDVIRPAGRAAESARATGAGIAREVHGIGVSAPVAEEFGGGGVLDAVTYCIAAEELAWGNPGIAWSILGSGLAARSHCVDASAPFRSWGRLGTRELTLSRSGSGISRCTTSSKGRDRFKG